MRVVHVNTSDFGGAAMAAIQLHVELLGRGVESVLLTLNKTRNDIPEHVQVDPFSISSRFAYKVRRLAEKTRILDDRRNQPNNIFLKNRDASREIFSLPFSFFDLERHPQIQMADVVHLHWVSYGLIDHQRFFRNCNLPMVWTMHDMHPFTGGCHHSDECENYKSDCLACPQLVKSNKAGEWLAYKKEGYSFLSEGKFKPVSPSQWLAHRMEKSAVMKKFRNEVIPNGFDSSVFHFREKSELRKLLLLPEDKFIVLFNAYDITNHRKGIRLLINALNKLNRRDLLLVGIGGSGKEIQYSGESLFPGYLSDTSELASWYGAADLFVLPSMAENLPNTISESLLCGTPCVAFNVGGIPEQIQSENGFLVEPGNETELASAIDMALEKKWNRKEISRDAQLKYDRVRIADRYLKIYKELLQ